MSNSPTLLRRSQLGELLVAEGKLSREELAAALAYREERGLKLGQALVALHLVTQQDLAGALRSQGRVHCLNLTPGVIDPEVARLLPEAMARQYVAVPVHRVAGRVTVAMEDPAEEYDVDAIAVALGEPVFAVHADPERILDAIGRVYQLAVPSPRPASEAARFTLVRGPLPETDPDEAAAKLVRAALREARAIGADSFHVESTARGAEMSFRVDGARTSPALLTADWADACARALVSLAGASPDSEHAAGSLELEGEALEIDIATIVGVHGRCTRAALRPVPVPITIEHLPLDVEGRATIRSWIAATGLLLVVGPSRAGCDALASELAARAANSGRRVYRLGSAGEPAVGVVAIARRAQADPASELRAIGEQCPDVVDAGRIAGGPAWSAALELARSGALVVARVEARDGASAVARLLRAVDDSAVAASSCTGAVSLREVRLLCPSCRTSGSDGPSAPGCASCGGTGLQGVARIAEVLDLQGPLREHVERDAGATGLRAAAAALGITTLDERGRELVRRGLTNEREILRALAR